MNFPSFVQMWNSHSDDDVFVDTCPTLQLQAACDCVSCFRLGVEFYHWSTSVHFVGVVDSVSKYNILSYSRSWMILECVIGCIFFI